MLFAVTLLYTFHQCATCINEVKEKGATTTVAATTSTLYFHDPGLKVVARLQIERQKYFKLAATRMTHLFKSGFAWMVVALVSWIIDNLCCPFLLSLPSPFHLNFHAYGWHFGTGRE